MEDDNVIIATFILRKTSSLYHLGPVIIRGKTQSFLEIHLHSTFHARDNAARTGHTLHYPLIRLLPSWKPLILARRYRFSRRIRFRFWINSDCRCSAS